MVISNIKATDLLYSVKTDIMSAGTFDIRPVSGVPDARAAALAHASQGTRNAYQLPELVKETTRLAKD